MNLLSLYHWGLTSEALSTGVSIWAVAWLLTRVPLPRDLIEEGFLALWRVSPIRLKHPIDLVFRAVSCHKCLTFWAVLIITANPIVALTLAAATEILSRD